MRRAHHLAPSPGGGHASLCPPYEDSNVKQLLGVIVRLERTIQYSRDGSRIHVRPLGYWIARPSAQSRTRRAMTSSETSISIPAARSARVLPKRWPSRERRAQGMPGARRTRGLVCSEESTRVRNRGYAEHSGIPCAMVFDVCRALPGVPGSVVTVACICCKLDTSVGVPGPHGFVDRTGRVRLTLPARPSHPAPNVRDDRVAPLLKGTGHRDKYTISDFRKYKYFYGAGWTLRNRLETADADLPDGYPHQISS
jgi:hypothetical protein